jgi:hypothetical protein
LRRTIALLVLARRRLLWFEADESAGWGAGGIGAASSTAPLLPAAGVASPSPPEAAPALHPQLEPQLLQVEQQLLWQQQLLWNRSSRGRWQHEWQWCCLWHPQHSQAGFAQHDSQAGFAQHDSQAGFAQHDSQAGLAQQDSQTGFAQPQLLQQLWWQSNRPTKPSNKQWWWQQHPQAGAALHPQAGAAQPQAGAAQPQAGAAQQLFSQTGAAQQLFSQAGAAQQAFSAQHVGAGAQHDFC